MLFQKQMHNSHTVGTWWEWVRLPDSLGTYFIGRMHSMPPPLGLILGKEEGISRLPLPFLKGRRPWRLLSEKFLNPVASAQLESPTCGWYFGSLNKSTRPNILLLELCGGWYPGVCCNFSSLQGERTVYIHLWKHSGGPEPSKTTFLYWVLKILRLILPSLETPQSVEMARTAVLRGFKWLGAQGLNSSHSSAFYG